MRRVSLEKIMTVINCVLVLVFFLCSQGVMAFMKRIREYSSKQKKWAD